MIFPSVLGTIGLALILFINKAQFERRNHAGVELYSSYWAMLLIRILSKIGRFLGVILIITAIGLACDRHKEQKALDKIEQAKGHKK